MIEIVETSTEIAGKGAVRSHTRSRSMIESPSIAAGLTAGFASRFRAGWGLLIDRVSGKIDNARGGPRVRMGPIGCTREPFRAGVDILVVSRETPHFMFSLACVAIVLGWTLFLTFAR